MFRYIYKESVELTSVYLIEGCGKTRSKIKRHNTPHSDRYGVSRHRTYLSSLIYTKVSVVPSRPFDQENFHIFNQGLAKNTFTICNVRRSRPKDRTKVKNVFNPDNTHIGYCVSGNMIRSFPLSSHLVKLIFYPILIQSITYQYISVNLKLIQNGIDTIIRNLSSVLLSYK